jgi:Family of unknown function (DUF6292)
MAGWGDGTILSYRRTGQRWYAELRPPGDRICRYRNVLWPTSGWRFGCHQTVILRVTSTERAFRERGTSMTDTLVSALDSGDILDSQLSFARGLRGYTAAVAAEMGVGLESCVIDTSAPASAYVALDVRLTRCPEHELAMLWDERFGWSVAMETSSGEDLTVLAYRAGDLLPDPAEVGAFLRAVLADDGSVGQPMPPNLATAIEHTDMAPHLREYELID